MHIPDGYLGPATYGSLWAVMMPVWYLAVKKINAALKTSQIPLLALASAFSFVIMMFNVPVPGGTSGHATGVTLIAILLGPWSAVIAISMSLFIQAFMFGDGGITALGANCFNIAFAEAFVGYGAYKLVSGLKFQAADTRHSPFVTRNLVGSAIGSYTGINVAALLTAIELGIQPLLHTGVDGRPLYSPFPLTVTTPAIMIGHLTIFGVIEAVITTLVLIYLRKSYPELIKG